MIFATPVTAKIIRLLPTEYNVWPTLRMELLGCRDVCFQPLGVQDGSVPDSSFTASSWRSNLDENDCLPANGRLNIGHGNDGTTLGGWCPATNNTDDEPWLAVDLGQALRVEGVLTQGGNHSDPAMMEWVTKFRVEYKVHSSDNWMKIKNRKRKTRVFPGNEDVNTPVRHLFYVPTVLRFIRIVVMDYEGYPSLRFEVLGCKAPSNITCPSPDSFTLAPGMGEVEVVFPAVTSTDPYFNRFTVTISDVDPLVSSGGVMWRVGENSTFPPPMNSNEQTVHYIATDDAGNQATCAWTFEVIDNEPPEFDNCENVTLYTDPYKNYTTAIPSAPTASDNIAATVECSAIPNQLEIGVHQVSCIANDSASNTDMCEFEIYVVDIQDPVISCPSRGSFPTEPRQPNATVVFPGDYVASDNSGDFQVIITELSPNSSEPNGMTWTVGDAVVLGIGDHTFFYLVTDGAGNEDYCAWDVEVYDNQDPVISCPPSRSFPTDPGQPNATVIFPDDYVASDNSGDFQVIVTEFSPNSSEPNGMTWTIGDAVVLGIGNHTFFYLVTDAAGNEDYCAWDVEVYDDQPPVLQCPSDVFKSTLAGSDMGTASWSPVTATDNSGVMSTIVASHTSGQMFTLGEHTVEFTGMDPYGNVGRCNFTVTITEFCIEPLGMEDLGIHGSSIFASSFFKWSSSDNIRHLCRAQNARLNLPLGTNPNRQNGGWCPDEADKNTTSYIQIDLGRSLQVEGIITQGGGFTDTDEWIEQYQLRYRYAKGQPWNYILDENGDIKEFTGNTDKSSPVTRIFDAPITAQFIRFIPTAYHVWPTLRMELLGCRDVCFQPLGVQDGSVPDSSFTASSWRSNLDENDCLPANGRLNFGHGNDGTTLGGWCPATNNTDNEPWLAVDLGQALRVEGVLIQGGNHSDPAMMEWVTKFRVDYKVNSSDDWMTIMNRRERTMVFLGNEDANTPNRHLFYVPTVVRFIRIVVIEYEGYPSLRFEVLGCKAPSNITCPSPDSFTLAPGMGEVEVVFPAVTSTDPYFNRFTVTISDVDPPVSSGGDMWRVGENSTFPPPMNSNEQTVHYIATDDAGNQATCAWTFEVIDNQPPVLQCPTDQEESTLDGSDMGMASWSLATVTDNSGVVSTPVASHTSGQMFTIGVHTVEFTAMDPHPDGNLGRCNFTVTITDNQAPVISCPPNGSFATDPGQPNATVMFPNDYVASDNSGEFQVIITEFSPNSSEPNGMTWTVGEAVVLGIGNHTFFYLVTDAAGNEDYCAWDVEVYDNQDPVISCPPNGSFPTDPGQPNATVMFPNDYVASDNSGEFQVIVTELSPNFSEPNGMTWTVGEAVVLGIGNHTFFYLVTDAAGNEDYCAWDVEVYDNQPPLLQCPTDVEESTIDGSDMGMASWSLATVTDNSGVVSTPVASHTSGQMFTIGVHTVEFTAMDPHPDGNLGRCNFTVTITDNQAPVISCPPNGSFATDPGQPNATVMFPNDFVTSDNSGEFQVIVTELSPNSSEPNGMTWTVGEAVVLGIGNHTFFYLVTDAAGNEDYCTWDVEVYDNQPPLLQCPTDVEESTIDGSDMGMASWSLATVTDNSGVVSTPVASHTSGQMFTIGVHTVEFTAMDPHPDGNLGRCNFTVTITDNQAPVISCPPNGSFATDPGQPNATVMFPNDYVASDNSGEFQVIVTELSPNSSEPNGMTWTVGDAVVLGIGNHTFFYLVTDAAGNEDHCTWDVEVYDNQPPLLQCPTDVEESTLDGSDMGMASWSLATVTDNSGVVSTPVASHTSGQMFTIGVHTVEFTAMDPHPDGNLGRCNFTVTITDNQAPVISCPPNGSFATDPGQPNATVMFPNDYVASDNSGEFQVIVTELSPNSSEPNGMTWTVGEAVVLGIGNHTFFYLVTDAAGNEDYCTWDVEVYDNQPPLLQCPTDVEESTIDGSDMGMASWSLATVTDNSGVVSTPVASHTSGQMFTIGVHTVEFTAMDPHPDGNLGRCNFTVTITDNQAPVISCPPNGSVATDPGQPNATVMFPNDYVASDNSGEFQVIVTELSPNSSEPNGMTWTVGEAVVLGIGNHTFFYLVTDAAGNEDYCAWDVEVYDNQPPLLQCPTDVEESTIDGSDMGMASWSLATVTDNSGVVSTPVASHTSGQMFTIGVHTVEFTAMDPHPDSNLGRCNFTVTITDNQAPVISCPPNGSFATDPGQPNATLMFPNDYVASDNSGEFQVIVTELSPNSSEPNGMTWTVGEAVVLGIGNHTFFYLVTDAAGNEDYCAWDVEVYATSTPKPATTHEAEPNSDTTTTGSVSDETNNGIITSTPNPISALEQTTSLEPFTVTETAQLTDECSPQNETPCSGDLTCIFLLGRHQCDCPFASGQSGDSDICIEVDEFRLSIVIVEFVRSNGAIITAEFNSAFLDPSSSEFQTLQVDLERILHTLFQDIPGFLRVRVFSFFSGSIGVVPIVSFNTESPTTMEMVEEALTRSITDGNLLSGSEYKVVPSLTTAQELVCEDGYCLNGGTCTPSTVDYASTCLCATGYSGTRCDEGQGVSSITIILILVACLVLIAVIVVVVCCFFAVGVINRRKQQLYQDHHGWDMPSADDMDLFYNLRYHTGSARRVPSGGFGSGTAYIASGMEAEEIAMHDLRRFRNSVI
ncbi:uncharacterized protein LOC119725269 isoform X4 [Patiria miniata]|uniref:Uncharacterized protein n=1 Tax=Patiria miniata TaxID=46514 RepID=A0A913ZNB1_PATMI|nr:uncharacterized protein LOC119725269 isoform X4 [Patiria miniata]